MYIGKHANLISVWMLEIEEAIAEMEIEETIAECMEIVRKVVNKKVGVINADFSVDALRNHSAKHEPVQHGCGNYCYTISRRGGSGGYEVRKLLGIHG